MWSFTFILSGHTCECVLTAYQANSVLLTFVNLFLSRRRDRVVPSAECVGVQVHVRGSVHTFAFVPAVRAEGGRHACVVPHASHLNTFWNSAHVGVGLSSLPLSLRRLHRINVPCLVNEFLTGRRLGSFSFVPGQTAMQ